MSRWTPPGGGSLREVMPSAAASLGVRGFHDTLGMGEADAVVVLLVDGLGMVPLRAALDRGGLQLPHLMAAMGAGREISAPFPSTTPSGLAALGTGLDTGCHGIVGASFRLPETGHALWPLAWRDEPHPTAVQPEATVLERVAAEGVRVTSVSPRAFESTGLTRAVLRGGDYAGADSFGERVGATARALAAEGRSLVYVYWGDLDKNGHVHGVDSDEWRAELELVDLLVGRLVDQLPASGRLLLTADHGMVDTVDSDRFEIDDDHELRHSAVMLAGEPRMRHVYVRPGAEREVRALWAERLADRAVVLSREQAVAEGWFGEVDPELVDRIGDVVVVAAGTTVLASQTVDSRSSGLRGQHGAATEAEMAIPLLAWG